MRDIDLLIANLVTSPDILENFLHHIPRSIMKRRRILGKWSIHEHACHLAVVQPMLYDRLVRFKTEECPEFKAYIPGKNVPDSMLIELDLDESLQKFREERKKLVELISDFSDTDWENEGKHPEYKMYSSYILVRHILMHDHLHMYRIEEQWITNDEYLRQ